jgi:hypothetical protein
MRLLPSGAGSVAGDGCPVAFRYRSEGDRITFQPDRGPNAVCEDLKLPQPSRDYAALLGRVARYERSEASLRLLDHEGREVLAFDHPRPGN